MQHWTVPVRFGIWVKATCTDDIILQVFTSRSRGKSKTVISPKGKFDGPEFYKKMSASILQYLAGGPRKTPHNLQRKI